MQCMTLSKSPFEMICPRDGNLSSSPLEKIGALSCILQKPGSDRLSSLGTYGMPRGGYQKPRNNCCCLKSLNSDQCLDSVIEKIRLLEDLPRRDRRLWHFLSKGPKTCRHYLEQPIRRFKWIKITRLRIRCFRNNFEHSWGRIVENWVGKKKILRFCSSDHAAFFRCPEMHMAIDHV